MKSNRPVSTARIVIYVAKRGDMELPPNAGSDPEMPAVITKVWDERQYDNSEVNLKVFTDGPHITWRTSVPYDENKTPGTWHWPEIK